MVEDTDSHHNKASKSGVEAAAPQGRGIRSSGKGIGGQHHVVKEGAKSLMRTLIEQMAGRWDKKCKQILNDAKLREGSVVDVGDGMFKEEMTKKIDLYHLGCVWAGLSEEEAWEVIANVYFDRLKGSA